MTTLVAIALLAAGFALHALLPGLRRFVGLVVGGPGAYALRTHSPRSHVRAFDRAYDWKVDR